MSHIPFKNKPVAVLNKAIPTGTAMNALAHMCFGLGTQIPVETARLSQYKDADGGDHRNISEHPMIVLKANSNKIRGLRAEALKCNIHFADFTHTMVEGGYIEQVKRTAQTKEEDLTYYGIFLFGDFEEMTALTRKFSLYK